MKCSLGISNFLEEISSLLFCSFPLFLCIDRWRRLYYLFLLFFGILHSDAYIFPFLLCFSLLFFLQLFVRPPAYLQTITHLILTYKAIYQLVIYTCWGILAPQGLHQGTIYIMICMAQVYRCVVQDLLYATEHMSLVTWGIRQCLSGGRAWWWQGYLNQHGGCNLPGAFEAPGHT